MARCGCSSDCLCTISGTDCIEVAGAGTSTSPYVVAAIVDPSEDNGLTCGSDGLLVDLAGVSVSVEATDCIELSGSGTPLDPVVASPVLDPDSTNVLKCGPNGLFASPIGVALWNVTIQDATYEASYGDMILANTAGGDVEITLPLAGELPGGVVGFKNLTASNSVIVTGSAAQTIDGASDLTSTTQYESATLMSDGFSWYVIASV